ncbi:MAG TPA: DUF5777 family beta-barrel protein [Vicinamibacterales bacterium]|nr:DUF5777 family beta-barrel protein [Vicinamibacterales bacterium]
MTRSFVRVLAAMTLSLCLAPAAFAQDDDDAVLKPAEPDFTLVGLPTSLRLPQFKSAFRVTHRFQGPLKDSGLGDLFGMDNGAQIGLEYRFGIIRNGQIGFYRTSDKTIDLFGEYGVLRQGASSPLDVSAVVAVEGTNNFQDSYSPSVGVVISRRIGDVAALYVEPFWVNNTNALPAEVVDDNDTVMVGIGGRFRIRPTVYLVAEVTPRVSGFTPNSNQASFAVEKRAGGHVFQLNVSNGFATTPASLGRGAFGTDNWYLGFNLSRKFY